MLALSESSSSPAGSVSRASKICFNSGILGCDDWNLTSLGQLAIGNTIPKLRLYI